jgi:hypothetical protein
MDNLTLLKITVSIGELAASLENKFKKKESNNTAVKEKNEICHAIRTLVCRTASIEPSEMSRRSPAYI